MDDDQEPAPLDTSGFETAIFRLMMDDLISTPEQRADDPERILHALDSLSTTKMRDASAQAVVDVMTVPPHVCRNYAAVEWSRRRRDGVESSEAIADHASFAAMLDALRKAVMPPATVLQNDFFGEWGGVGDPAHHVAVLLRASPQAWATWADVIAAVSG